MLKKLFATTLIVLTIVLLISCQKEDREFEESDLFAYYQATAQIDAQNNKQEITNVNEFEIIKIMDNLLFSDNKGTSSSLLGNVTLGENNLGKLNFVLNYYSGDSLEGYFEIEGKINVLGMYIKKEDKTIYLEKTQEPHFGTINNDAISHKTINKVGYFSQYNTGYHIICDHYGDYYYWLENFLIDDSEVDYNTQSVIVYYVATSSGGDEYTFNSVSFLGDIIYLNLTQTKTGMTMDMSGWVFSFVVSNECLSNMSNVSIICIR
jgi:hypothetical protein